jgi:AbrB family looped-hinge helix DNA binding protein
MSEKSEFDAIVNANFAVSIPAATRDKLGIEKGDILKVSIEKAPKVGGSRR